MDAKGEFVGTYECFQMKCCTGIIKGAQRVCDIGIGTGIEEHTHRVL